LKKVLITIFFILILPLKSIAQDINVAYTIDKNYSLFAMISIFSVLENNYLNNKYNFFIVENDIPQKRLDEMKNFVNKRGQNIYFIHINSDDICKGENIYLSLHNRISKIGMARILLPDLLPKNIHRVIYIDADTLVSDDLSKLYNVDLKNNIFGMVKDIHPFLEGKVNQYYNSGLIVMDLDKSRKEKISDKLFNFYYKNHLKFSPDSKGKIKYWLADQDLINLVLKNNIEKLPNKWNNQILADYIMMPQTNGIYHYIGDIKPWHFPKSNVQSYKLYYYYWNKSPFKKYKYYYYFASFNKIYMRNVLNLYNSIKSDHYHLIQLIKNILWDSKYFFVCFLYN